MSMQALSKPITTYANSGSGSPFYAQPLLPIALLTLPLYAWFGNYKHYH